MVKPENNTVIELPESKMNDAADLLARAFYDDPLMLYLFPDDSERRDMGKRFFLPNLKHATQQGKLYTTGSFRGVAVWHFLGINPVIEKGTADDPRVQLPVLMGADAFQRLMYVVQCTGEIHKKLMPGKHCYLLFLGVDTGWQSKGIGAALIKPVLEMADEKGLPCYLETNKAINVEFYRKQGFEVGEERQMPHGGPYVWGLVRTPKTK
jgi:ribosomal protein S18 acetylase RimI-like enzyme